MKLSRRCAFSPFSSVGLDWPAFVAAHPVPEPGDLLPSRVSATGFSPLRYLGGVLAVDVVTYTKKVDPDTVKRIAQVRFEELVARDIQTVYSDVWSQVNDECLAKATPERKAVSLLIDGLPTDGPELNSVLILATGRAAEDVETFIRACIADDFKGEETRPRLISRYAAARERVRGTSPTPVLWAWKNVPQGGRATVGEYDLEVIGPIKVKGAEVKASITGDFALNAAVELEDAMGAVPMDLWIRCENANWPSEFHLKPEGIDRLVQDMSAKDWREIDLDDKVEGLLRAVDDAVAIYETLLEKSGEQEGA